MKKLQALIDETPKTNTAKVAEHIDDIERALEAGVTREKIYEALKQELGLTCTLEGFRYALKRARAARQPKGTEIKNASATVAAHSTKSVSTNTSSKVASPLSPIRSRSDLEKLRQQSAADFEEE